jgi:asparaginyl-tRNA synthetase
VKQLLQLKEQLAAAAAAAAGSGLPFLPDGAVDYSQDFFGERTALTVSGQLNGGRLACAWPVCP